MLDRVISIETNIKKMENLTIASTNHTPEVDFKVNGNLKLEGRSYPENADKFYIPLIEFASELSADHIIFDSSLDYINTASSKILFSLMQLLDEKEDFLSVQVNWHYEEGDEDSIETAEIYEDSLERVKFTYNEYADLNA